MKLILGALLLIQSLNAQSLCIPSITVPVQEQCSVQLSPTDVLSSTPAGLSSSDLTVVIENYNGPGSYVYAVRLNQGVNHNFAGCKGLIEVIDLKAPVLEAPGQTTFRWAKLCANAMQREITTGNFKKIPQQINCFKGSFHSSAFPFDSLVFTVPQDGFYSFFLISEFPAMATLAKFGSEENCKFILDASEDFPKPGELKPGKDLLDLAQNSWLQPNDTFDVRLSGNLKKGENYILTSFSKSTSSLGRLVWIILSDQKNLPGDTLLVFEGSGVLSAQNRWLSIPLYWNDLNVIQYTGKYKVNGDGEFLEGDSSLIKILSQTGFPHTYSGNQNTPAPSILNGFAYYGFLRDSCGPIEIGVYDQLMEEGDCLPKTLERNFWARDPSGNFSTLKKQIIQFRSPLIDEILFPSLSTIIGCGEDSSPTHTGAPYYWSEKGKINYEMAGYSDLNETKICGGGYSFLRRWTIFDWCNPSKTRIFNQIIQVIDTTPPSLEIPDYFEISTSPFSCQAAWQLPSPDSLQDNCSEVFLKHIFFSERKEILQPGDPLLLDTGLYHFIYSVEDGCGLIAEKTLTLKVIDQIKPSISCDPVRNVSLGYIEALRFSEGSYDHCYPVKLTIRKWLKDSCAIQSYLDEKQFLGSFENALIQEKIFSIGEDTYYTDWEEKVGIGCCEAEFGEVLIEVKATELSYGLSNTCRTILKVEDKQPVFCISPPDVEVICDQKEWIDLSPFGMPTAQYGCGFFYTELPAKFDLDHCGTGTILRKFVVFNAGGNMIDTCNQTITIQPRHKYVIEFPANLRIEDCIDFPVPVPRWTSQGCDLITHSIDTSIFYTTSEACFEFQTRHRLLNWCEFEEGMTPVLVPPGDQIFIIRDSTGAYLDKNDILTDGFIEKLGGTGFYEYTHTIRVQDRIGPVISHPVYPPVCAYESCLVKMQLPFIVQDACDNNGISFEFFYDENRDGIYDDILQLYSEDEIRDSLFGIFGRAPKLTLIAFFPVGKHQLIVNAKDGCGNKSSKAIPFEVLDCKPPSPTCIEGLAVELMPDSAIGMVETFDFLVNIPEDCLGPVEFSIHRLDEKPEKGKNSLQLGCEDLGLTKVKIVAWDRAFNPFARQPDSSLGGPNYSFCITTIHVQDNLYPLCEKSISGMVLSETGKGLKGVSVFFAEDSSHSVFTDERGNFKIEGNGTLHAYYEGPFLSGISTYDLVLISRHVLGQETLKSEFQKIAADVNGSGSISTLDMIELRKVILGINHDFGAVPSWQFLKRNLGNDFIAIKTGDVNHSAFDDIAVVGRSRMALKIEEKIFREKETFEVKIPLKNVFDFSGGQVGLEIDPKKLILKNIFSSAFWHVGKDGILRMLWTKEDLTDQEIRLELESIAESSLSESLRLSGKFESQVYGSGGEIIPIVFEWKSEQRNVQFFPNPFSEFTEIDLTGFSSSQWVLEVYNGIGVKILEKTNLGGVVKISRKELGNQGVFWAVFHGEDKEILSFKIFHTHD